MTTATPVDQPDELLLLLLRKNSACRTPLPVCKGCRFPFAPGDAGFMRRRGCWTCDFAQVYRLIRRIVRRRGGLQTLVALRHLSVAPDLAQFDRLRDQARVQAPIGRG
jgi:hypothetical protein